MWALAGAWAGVGTILAWRFVDAARSSPVWACPRCGFDMRARARVYARCSECGAERRGFRRLESLRRRREAGLGMALILWVWMGVIAVIA